MFNLILLKTIQKKVFAQVWTIASSHKTLLLCCCLTRAGRTLELTLRKIAMNLGDLPGAELILFGLEDLHRGRSDTVGALLVAIASTRLTEAGLGFPRSHLALEPELMLYRRLQGERDDAYHYHNAFYALEATAA